MTIREQWNALLRLLGPDPSPDGPGKQRQTGRPGEAPAASPEKQPDEPTDPAAPEIPDTQEPANPVPAEPSEMWKAARATATEQREDPSPAEPALSSNAQAYENDLRCFRWQSPTNP